MVRKFKNLELNRAHFDGHRQYTTSFKDCVVYKQPTRKQFRKKLKRIELKKEIKKFKNEKEFKKAFVASDYNETFYIRKNAAYEIVGDKMKHLSSVMLGGDNVKRNDQIWVSKKK